MRWRGRRLQLLFSPPQLFNLLPQSLILMTRSAPLLLQRSDLALQFCNYCIRIEGGTEEVFGGNVEGWRRDVEKIYPDGFCAIGRAGLRGGEGSPSIYIQFDTVSPSCRAKGQNRSNNQQPTHRSSSRHS